MTFLNLEQKLTHISLFSPSLAIPIFWGKSFYTTLDKISFLEKITMKIAFFRTTSFLLTRWASSTHFPLSNLYESFMFLSWSFIPIHFILKDENGNPSLGIITAPSAVLVQGFATLGLPKEMKESIFLVPSSQSYWSIMHVTMMILSYATLLCGSSLAITFLIILVTKQKYFSILTFPINLPILYNPFHQLENEMILHGGQKMFFFINFRKWQLIKKLDNWSYRIISLGFPLLTIGIIPGAVWANETWGSYWNWDPKETWALITWLLFAIYLHTRMIEGWQGKKPAIIASLGSFIVWICYLGVNSLGKGLHSYGWLI
uniref:Cytochrome c biogenesis protein CcsA n=1 Tax=Cyathodium smaragdinum TaxID=2846787 RepID=A0A8F3BEG8_9MARC|nr:cytochrome c heme attachment protein [Cyathodium smaragdinum]